MTAPVSFQTLLVQVGLGHLISCIAASLLLALAIDKTLLCQQPVGRYYQ